MLRVRTQWSTAVHAAASAYNGSGGSSLVKAGIRIDGNDASDLFKKKIRLGSTVSFACFEERVCMVMNRNSAMF